MTRKKRAVIEYQSYLFSIIKCSVDYSLFINNGNFVSGPYFEAQSLTIQAECIFPAKECGSLFELVFLGNRGLEDSFHEQKHLGGKPSSVGTLTVKKDRKEFLGSIPSGAFWGIESAVGRGRIKSIVLHGEKSR